MHNRKEGDKFIILIPYRCYDDDEDTVHVGDTLTIKMGESCGYECLAFFKEGRQIFVKSSPAEAILYLNKQLIPYRDDINLETLKILYGK